MLHHDCVMASNKFGATVPRTMVQMKHLAHRQI